MIQQQNAKIHRNSLTPSLIYLIAQFIDFYCQPDLIWILRIEIVADNSIVLFFILQHNNTTEVQCVWQAGSRQSTRRYVSITSSNDNYIDLYKFYIVYD